jgi:hypothetical protein
LFKKYIGRPIATPIIPRCAASQKPKNAENSAGLEAVFFADYFLICLVCVPSAILKIVLGWMVVGLVLLSWLFC